MSYQLIDLVQSLDNPRLLVLGDLILDRYLWGNAERISQEAPVILLREEKQELRLGGAANVAQMIRGLDAHVTLAGVVGADVEGEQMCALLKEQGISCEAIIVDQERPTTCKERIIGKAQHRHPHQMLRIDRETRGPLSSIAKSKLWDRLIPAIEEHDAILISDYAKGVCDEQTLERVVQIARLMNKPVIVDPASIHDYRMYRGVTAMTPNRVETGKAADMEIKTIEDAFEAGRRLVKKLSMDRIFVTLDKDGIAIVESNGQCEHFPTRLREVYDITGAGDMVLAMIGVGAAAGWDAPVLAKLANVAGGLEVEQVGVVAISRPEIVADLVRDGHGRDNKVYADHLLTLHLDARRRMKQKIVLTNGCFDVLHIGHVSYLKEAASLGDCLVVAINSDESVRSLGKGTDRPIFAQEQRATMLAALECVDYVLIYGESTPHRVLELVRPDILVKGGTYRLDEVVGREIVQAYGGQVRVLQEIPGVSSTTILSRLRGEHVSADESMPATIPLPGLPAQSDPLPLKKAV